MTSIIAGLFAGCVVEPREPSTVATPELTDWARTEIETTSVSLNWLADMSETRLNALVAEALQSNFQLAQQRALLEDARQSVIVSGAGRWPSLSAGLGGSRRSVAAGSGTTSGDGTSYDLDANVAWELDVWGKLSNTQQAARLAYEADLADFEAERRELVASTVSLAYNAVTDRQLLELFRQRLDSLESTYDIIYGSYKRGLGDALDVYLARNALEQQRQTVAAQEQSSLASTAELQLTLGRYPDGNMSLPDELPLENSSVPVGLPSELLTRRQDVVAAWLDLLAADARIAVAHKNRFPSLRLTGSGGNTSDELGDVIDTDLSTWSVAASLTQPIFEGGRLRAAQYQAEARAQASEQGYLSLVYRAFGEVENAISGSRSLRTQYDALLSAESNARAAQALAFEQYQRGLVSFTTVLEADRRAFDSGTALVRVRNQLIQNRITLYRALGGAFELDNTT